MKEIWIPPAKPNYNVTSLLLSASVLVLIRLLCRIADLNMRRSCIFLSGFDVPLVITPV